jgi:hypothetical protein
VDDAAGCAGDRSVRWQSGLWMPVLPTSALAAISNAGMPPDGRLSFAEIRAKSVPNRCHEDTVEVPNLLFSLG